MINFAEYDKFENAKADNNEKVLATMRAEKPRETAIYEQVYQYKLVQGYVAVLDNQRAEEQKYQVFVGKYAMGILKGSLPASGFRLNGKWDFYERFCRENGVKMV